MGLVEADWRHAPLPRSPRPNPWSLSARVSDRDDGFGETEATVAKRELTTRAAPTLAETEATVATRAS